MAATEFTIAKVLKSEITKTKCLHAESWAELALSQASYSLNENCWY